MHFLIELGILVLTYFANRAIAAYMRNRQKPPMPGGFEIPTIPSGACIPVVYGTRRIRPITVYMAYAKLVEFNVSTKEVFGIVNRHTEGYGFKVTAMQVLCWGQIDCIRNMVFGTTEKLLSDQPMSTDTTMPIIGTIIQPTFPSGSFICAAGGPGDPGPHTDSIEVYGGGRRDMQMYLPRIFGGFGRGGMWSAIGGDDNNPYGRKMRLYIGSGQTFPDEIIEGFVGAGNLPAYRDIAYIVLDDVQIGETSTPEPVDYILGRWPKSEMLIPGGSGTPVVNTREITSKSWNWVAADCSAAAALYDLLRNPIYGLGIPDHQIMGPGLGPGSFEHAQRALVDEGLGISLVFSGDRKKAQDTIDEILRTVDAVLIRDPETFKYRINLIRNEATSPAAFDALRSIGPKDIVSIGPVTRNEWSETHNVITVEFSNAEKLYNKDTVTVRNEANIAMTGSERPLTVQYMMVTDRRVALKLAARDLKRESLRLWKGPMKITRTGWDLERGDVFKLNYPKYGFEELLCRVMSADFGEETDSTISITWIEDIFHYDDIVRPTGLPTSPVSLPVIVSPKVTGLKQEVVTVAGVQTGRLTITLADTEKRTYEIKFRTSEGGAPPSAWDIVATAVPNTGDPLFPYGVPVCAPALNGDYTYDVPLSGSGSSTIQYQITAVGYGTVADPTLNAIILQDTLAWPTIGELSPTGVVPDTYGDTTHVPVITVDADGRIIVAGEALISSSVPDGSITTAKLADGAVTEIKLADNSVTAAKIAANAVGSSELDSTGVGAGTYGDATHIPRLTVDLDGRIILASEVLASGGGGGARPVGVGFDGMGGVITLNGETKMMAGPVSFAGNISLAAILAAPNGSATIGVKKCAVADFPAGLVDITGGNDIVLTGASESVDTALVGWTLAVAIGDVFEFELKVTDEVIKRLVVLLHVV